MDIEIDQSNPSHVSILSTVKRNTPKFTHFYRKKLKRFNLNLLLLQLFAHKKIRETNSRERERENKKRRNFEFETEVKAERIN